VRIIARIEKVAPDQYWLDGETFDNFLSARHQLYERMKRLRQERLARASEGLFARMQTVEA